MWTRDRQKGCMTAQRDAETTSYGIISHHEEELHREVYHDESRTPTICCIYIDEQIVHMNDCKHPCVITFGYCLTCTIHHHLFEASGSSAATDAQRWRFPSPTSWGKLGEEPLAPPIAQIAKLTSQLTRYHRSCMMNRKVCIRHSPWPGSRGSCKSLLVHRKRPLQTRLQPAPQLSIPNRARPFYRLSPLTLQVFQQHRLIEPCTLALALVLAETFALRSGRRGLRVNHHTPLRLVARLATFFCPLRHARLAQQ